jgi:hypothetical protein
MTKPTKESVIALGSFVGGMIVLVSVIFRKPSILYGGIMIPVTMLSTLYCLKIVDKKWT